MFVEVKIRGGGTTTVNTDKVVRVEPVATDVGHDARSTLILENSPNLDVLYTVEDTLKVLAGKKIDAAEDATEAPATAAPHSFTVAELRQRAADKSIDLGDSTRKSDIRDKLIAGLNVADLRLLASQEGIDLHGAQSRDDIVGALNADPAVDESSLFSTTSSSGVGSTAFMQAGGE